MKHYLKQKILDSVTESFINNELSIKDYIDIENELNKNKELWMVYLN